jgi:hypothetical protein
MQPTTPSPVFEFSFPTKAQFIHGVERTLIVFVLAAASYIKLHTGSFGSEVWSGAGWAGIAAVYQFILSTLTNL